MPMMHEAVEHRMTEVASSLQPSLQDRRFEGSNVLARSYRRIRVVRVNPRPDVVT
jgi:hypothetical protein